MKILNINKIRNIVFITIFFIICFNGFSLEKLKENGIIDLKAIDLEKVGIVDLDGKWEFYWGEFLEYTNEKNSKDNYQKVPETWIKYKIENKNLSGYGYASYKVKVKLDKQYDDLGIAIARLGGVYKLWIDGKLYISNGEIGKEYFEEKISYKDKTLYFTTEKDEFDILIHMSNFNYNKGGIWESLKFGTAKNIERYVNKKIALNIFVLGSLMLMGLHCLILFTIYKNEKRFLYFGIFSLNVALRYISTGKAFNLFFGENFPEILRLKLEYINFYIGVAILSLFMKSLFEKEYSKRIVDFTVGVSFFYVISTVVMPFRIIDKLNYGYQAFTIFVGIVLINGIIKAVKRKREGAKTLVVAFIIMWVLFLSDLFSAIGFLRIPTMGYIGTYIFMFFQSYINFKYLYSKKDENKSLELQENMNLEKRKLSLNNINENYDISRKDVNSIIAYTKGLNSLINDILNFSKLKTGEVKLDKKLIYLKVLVDFIISLLKKESDNKNIKIINNIDSKIKTYADEDMIKQIFYNIIGNAVKYSEDGEVIIDAVEKEKEILICVKDEGIGISEEKAKEIKIILENKLEFINKEAGLGLSISKSLLDIFNGKIWFRSEENKGSFFYFTLEIGKEKTKSKINSIVYISDEPQRRVFKNKELIKYKILAVDDEYINLNVLVGFLTLQHHEIVIAGSGKEALELLDDSFSLVILDVMMPEMTGFEVCKKIREKYSLSEMPVLMLTAKNQYSDIEIGFESGANDYSIKPIEKRELLKRVEALLKLKSTTEERINKIIKKENEKRDEVFFEKIKDFGDKLSKKIDYKNILDILFEELIKINAYQNLIFIMTKEKEAQILKVNIEKGKKIEISKNDTEILKNIFNQNIEVVENLNYSWTEENIENYSIPIKIGMDIEIVLYLEINEKLKDGSYEMEILKHLISQTIIALENVYLFLKKEDEMRKVMVIEQLSSRIYMEKNTEKVIDYIIHVLLFSLEDHIKKVYYFDYYKDSESLLMRKSAENKFELSEQLISNENIMQKIEESVNNKESKKEYMRIIVNEIEELKNKIWEKNVKLISDSNVKKMLKAENILFSSVVYDENKFGAILIELKKSEIEEELKEIIKRFSENLALFLNKILEEERTYEIEEEKSFRCKKCNAKLSEYKGSIDFLEIKCHKCNTMNKIEKKNINLKKNR